MRQLHPRGLRDTDCVRCVPKWHRRRGRGPFDTVRRLPERFLLVIQPDYVRHVPTWHRGYRQRPDHTLRCVPARLLRPSRGYELRPVSSRLHRPRLRPGHALQLERRPPLRCRHVCERRIDGVHPVRRRIRRPRLQSGNRLHALQRRTRVSPRPDLVRTVLRRDCGCGFGSSDAVRGMRGRRVRFGRRHSLRDLCGRRGGHGQ